MLAFPGMEQYLWMVVVGAFVAFGFGWATGSNDVANAFGTSVGAKTLSLRQAVVIAAIFEAGGALLLGRVSTNTIAGGIADINSFLEDPEVYAYGMICALLVGTIWQGLASKMGVNVSATHSIIGGIVGFALVWGGSDAVIWAQKAAPGEVAFPPYKGVISIILAWFIAPVLTGSVAALLFFTLRFLVLRRQNAYNLAFWVFPPLVLITTWVNMYFVFTKGAKKALSTGDDSWTDTKAVWVSACIAGGAAILMALLTPVLKKRADSNFDADGKRINKEIPLEDIEAAKKTEGEEEQPQSLYSKAKTAALYGTSYNIHAIIDSDAAVHKIHSGAEVFEERVEFAFGYLQVFSAICVIFAHGAGEVGYMVGPLTTIWKVYGDGFLAKKVDPPIWVVIIGATGLVIGLATYGYNVTRTMGVQLAKITPARGFCAELATAGTIMFAAQYGLPTSSSQCITGAIVGVALLEGAKGVNWKIFVTQFVSWVLTLVAVGGFVALIFAQGIYAPSRQSLTQQHQYETRVSNLTTNLYKDFNTSLYAYRAGAAAGALPTLSAAQWSSLNSSVAKASSTAKGLVDLKKRQTVEANDVMTNLYKAIALFQQNTVLTLGQAAVFNGSTGCNAVSSAATPALCQAPKLLPTAYQTRFP
ncbi:sodium phosphate symporter [Klebsormidium nitens]|uniref:Phosphate transporter n=1 Tax=Klebsormidium nitens TaxID=105231 RepID=A0A1Y1IGE2_KLENI|nr:sodium phosphate symporter [Klebsormidium nitens]|eukprot:GAQ87816.1 sodium phosphate symporter [Klebsormidium nitens]